MHIRRASSTAIWKPSNILVSLIGDRPVPRIIDFGIAKAIAQPLTDRPVFTELGGFLGTPGKTGHEQADASVDVDTRGDIYSLGVLLYELLAGTLPFERNGEARRRRGDSANDSREGSPRPSIRVTQLGSDIVTIAERRRIPP